MQDGVSLAHDPLQKSTRLKAHNSFMLEKSSTQPIAFQPLPPEKLHLRFQFFKNIYNQKISFYSPESRIRTEIVNKPSNEFHSERVLAKTLDLIREFEGFRSQAYRDSNGSPVIGYGLSKVAGKKVRIGDRISAHQAEAALKAEVKAIQEQIKSIVEVELTPHQLGALTSFAFNTGFYGLKRSTLLRKLNAGDYHGAANEFLRWNKAHFRGRLVPLAGLTKRRQAERKLFLTEHNLAPRD